MFSENIIECENVLDMSGDYYNEILNINDNLYKFKDEYGCVNLKYFEVLNERFILRKSFIIVSKSNEKIDESVAFLKSAFEKSSANFFSSPSLTINREENESTNEICAVWLNEDLLKYVNESLYDSEMKDYMIKANDYYEGIISLKEFESHNEDKRICVYGSKVLNGDSIAIYSVDEVRCINVKRR